MHISKCLGALDFENKIKLIARQKRDVKQITESIHKMIPSVVLPYNYIRIYDFKEHIQTRFFLHGFTCVKEVHVY